jgi:hypothetical protein
MRRTGEREDSEAAGSAEVRSGDEGRYILQPRMSDRPLPEPLSFSQLPPRILDEVLRQFRATRNDILRYAVWNSRNLTDEEFNHTEDRRLFNYFRQDLLETKFLSKGRRVDLIMLWNWFDDQMRGGQPLLIQNRDEHFLNIQDKDLEKVRKRMSEIGQFLPLLRENDFEGFKKIKFKLRRTVLRMTYDLHHLSKRLDKYRKGPMPPFSSSAPLPMLAEVRHAAEDGVPERVE